MTYINCNLFSYDFKPGVDKATISAMITAAGVVEIIFRVVNGLIADRKIINIYIHFVIATLTAGVATVIGAVFPGMAGKIAIT